MTTPYFSTAGDPFDDRFVGFLDDQDDPRQTGMSHDMVPPDLSDDDRGDELDDNEYELWSRD